MLNDLYQLINIKHSCYKLRMIEVSDRYISIKKSIKVDLKRDKKILLKYMFLNRKTGILTKNTCFVLSNIYRHKRKEASIC